jgi:uncharacterized membrane protein
MSELIAITYDDQTSGRSAFDALGEMQKMQVLTLEDAALAYKDEKGKVKVKQTLENQHTGEVGKLGIRVDDEFLTRRLHDHWYIGSKSLLGDWYFRNNK